MIPAENKHFRVVPVPLDDCEVAPAIASQPVAHAVFCRLFGRFSIEFEHRIFTIKFYRQKQIRDFGLRVQ